MLINSLLHRFFRRTEPLSLAAADYHAWKGVPAKSNWQRAERRCCPLTVQRTTDDLLRQCQSHVARKALWHTRHHARKKGGERGKGRRRVHLYLNILEGGKRENGKTQVGEAWSRESRQVQSSLWWRRRRRRRWTGWRANIFRYLPLRHDLLRDRIWSEAMASDVQAEMTGLSPLVHARPNPTNSTASKLRNIHVLRPYINIRAANQMPCRYSFLCCLFLTKFSQISICIFSRWFCSLFDHTGWFASVKDCMPYLLL